MVRSIRHFPANRPNGSVNNSLFDEKRPLFPVPTDDIFDELIASLTNPPDVAAPNIAPPAVAAKEPALVRLPSVEDFRFEDAAAKCMASKLAPDQKPRSKIRRPRYRSPNRDRWRFPGEPPDQPDVQNAAECDADNRDLGLATATPRGSRHGLFWSFCASILIVMGTSAAFGFVQPLNDLLPKRMGDVLSDISDNLGARGAGLFNRADRSADIEVADGNPNSDKDVFFPAQPMATAVVAHLVSTTSIAAEVRPSVNSGGSGIVVEQAEPPGATSEKAFELGATVLELGKIDGAMAEFTTPESAPAPADKAIEENPPRPALLQSVKADPLPIPNTPALADESVASAAQPVMSPLSAAQIDRLLARGEDLLQSGDIASARLVFLRVAAAGDKRGAGGMGMTYDPRFYARLPVTGLTPDREMAEVWYKKAGENPTFPTARKTIADTRKLDVADARKAQEARSAKRNAACARKYRSFEPNSGLYTAHSGVKRRCRLP